MICPNCGYNNDPTQPFKNAAGKHSCSRCYYRLPEAAPEEHKTEAPAVEETPDVAVEQAQGDKPAPADAVKQQDEKPAPDVIAASEDVQAKVQAEQELLIAAERLAQVTAATGAGVISQAASEQAA